MLRPSPAAFLVATAIAAVTSPVAAGQIVSRPGARVTTPALAVGDDGTRSLAWIQSSPHVDGPRVMVATARAGRAFGVPRVLASTSAAVGTVAVAVTPRGTTVVLWTAESPPFQGAPVVVWAETLGRRGPAGRPVVLTLPTSSIDGAPVLAIGA
ncbi:MAG: hypothetical protein JWN32_3111, partial [Solirubrobacterales bacterium]|nr:hypothetical protein [Solirubrobacterales bacterium]